MQGDTRFKRDNGKGDSPRFFKCGSTDYLIADYPEASPYEETKKGTKVKFAALVAKLSPDTLDDPSRLFGAHLNDCMEVNYLFELRIQSHDKSTKHPRSFGRAVLGE
jgi:hypothetical protein